MTYDWEGRRTKRLQTLRLVTAIMAGLVVPLAITAWQYVA